VHPEGSGKCSSVICWAQCSGAICTQRQHSGYYFIVGSCFPEVLRVNIVINIFLYHVTESPTPWRQYLHLNVDSSSSDHETFHFRGTRNLIHQNPSEKLSRKHWTQHYKTLFEKDTTIPFCVKFNTLYAKDAGSNMSAKQKTNSVALSPQANYTD
jgi:hypothetical protein